MDKIVTRNLSQTGTIVELFWQSQALLEGHFVLTSGQHSAQYMQCAQVLQYPDFAERLGRELASSWQGQAVDTVIGPAMGGIIVAHEVGRALGIRALFTERENGRMRLRRGFSFAPGERVLVVEDVITTGGSVQEVLALVREAGALPIGVAVLVDRSNRTANFGLPLTSLLQLNIESFESRACPLCQAGLPVVKPGSRQKI